MSLKSKIVLVFFTMILLDVLVGIGIDTSVRQAGRVTNDLVTAGRKIRASREVANGILEENYLLLLAVSPGQDSARARELILDRHQRILDLIRRYWPDQGNESLRERYLGYWEEVERYLGESAAPMLSGAELEDFYRRHTLLAAGDSEKTARILAEGAIAEMERIRFSRSWHDGLYRILGLPRVYVRAVEELGRVYDAGFESQKIWNALVRLQIGVYGFYYWGGRDREIEVRRQYASLVAGINRALQDDEGVGPMPVRRPRRDLLVDVRDWAAEFVSLMDPAKAGPPVARQADLVAHFIAARSLQLRLFRQSEMEIERLTGNVDLVRESVTSLTQTYTTVFLVFALAALGVALLLGRVILRPVRTLLEGYRRMAEGDFGFRIAEVQKDEFGELQSGFNQMAEALERHERELKRARDDLEELAFKIQNYSEDLEQEVGRRTAELHQALSELKETDRLKSEFIANMSHELRTPLNSIIGFSKVILKGIDGPVTAKQKEDLQLIHQSGKHLLNLITQVLDFSRLEAGGLRLVRETVHLKEIGEEALRSVRPLVKEAPVKLMMDYNPHVPPIEGDPVRLQQVMINLLGNAVKFTEKGWIRLEIRPWQADDPDLPEEPVAFDRGVLIRVQDTGIGIAEEDRSRVFQKFQQADGSSSRAYGGTGLGLAITREIVTLHGGHIWYTSRKGVGSAFFVLLPVGDVPPVPQTR